MTASLVLLGTGVILQAWSTSTTANVQLGNFVHNNLGPSSVGQDVDVIALAPEVGMTVIYVPAGTTVPMIRLTCREYLVSLGITAQRVRHCSDFAQVEPFALA